MGKIYVFNNNENQLLDVNEIKYMQAEGNCTNIFMTRGKKYFDTKTLKYYHTKYHENGFYRVHDKYLVNLSYCKSIDKGRGGYITLDEGERIAISYRRKFTFRKYLKQNINHKISQETLPTE